MSLDYTSYMNLDPKSHNESSILNSAHFLYFLDFLNSSRAGSAQSTAGISFQTFISSLMVSLLYCVFQTSIFSLLRCKFKNIYQPNCYYVPREDKVLMIGDGFFDWVLPTISNPLRNYKKMGLDAYFFLRYLRFLVFLFLGLSLFNLPILIPVNYYSGYDSYSPADLLAYTNGTIAKVNGLDRISMSNIAPKFSSRLSIHLTMATISILWFHGLVLAELWRFIKIKNIFLAEAERQPHSDKFDDHGGNFTRMLLIDNVPSRLLDKKELTKLFKKMCGAKVKNVWFVLNYREVKTYHKKHLYLLDKIETLETLLIEDKFYNHPEKVVTDAPTYNLNRLLSSIRSTANYRFKLAGRVVPVVYYASLQDQINDAADEYIHNRVLYENEKHKLRMKDKGPINDYKYNKAFIEFEDSIHPDILNQVQISNKLNELNNTLVYVNPKDIIWDNLSVQSNMLTFLRRFMGNALECVVILGWVVPVAFFGLISQLPYLTALIPPLHWLNYLPVYITDVISNLLSVFLLVCLTQLVPYILRWISYFKCARSGAEVELDVQKWMFIFLFVHIFLVVTISSGFSVIFESLVNNPVSIPNILASNLPKCSNFFFSYVIIRGLSYFGNNLIQAYQLFMNSFIYPLKDYTGRRRFNRLSNPPTYLWGSIYPTMSIIGAIGLVYSIIAPLILLFCLLTFLMVFFSFKYSLTYQYNIRNHSETYGQFYPTAIFQLYSGVYFMEACLIGMFALSRNEKNEADCLSHALMTFVLLIMTAVGEAQIHKMFKGLLSQNLPLVMHENPHKLANELNMENEKVVSGVNEKRDDTFYRECFQDKENVVWLPQDPYGIVNAELQNLRNLGVMCSADKYFTLQSNGDLCLERGPPDV